MASMGGRDAGSWLLGAALVVAGCGDDEGGRIVPMPGSTSDGSTSALTTFEPTTTVDPSAAGMTTGTDSGPDGSGTEDGTTGGTGSSSGNEETAASSSGGDEAPSVQSTTPADLDSGVPADTAIEVTFSEVMDPSTLTTNTGDDRCTGALQVSTDGFATCVQMTGDPSSADDQTFTVTPTTALPSTAIVQIRVVASVTDVGGTPMEADFTTDTGFIVRYGHTIIIDGTNDFTAGETFGTSTMAHEGFVAWDEDYIYLGMDSPDLAADSNQEWFVSYLGGMMGTTAGVTYNTQGPLLPFEARWHVRWRADDTFGGGLEWTGAAWQDAAFGLDPDDVSWNGSYVELRVSRADLGTPDYLDLHLGMLTELPLSEWSWAAVPSGSYVDGYDPDYAEFFPFDLSGSTLPGDYLPM